MTRLRLRFQSSWPECLLSECVFDRPPVDSSPVFLLLLQEENVAISPRAKQRQQLLGLCWRWRPVKIPWRPLNFQPEASSSQRIAPTWPHLANLTWPPHRLTLPPPTKAPAVETLNWTRQSRFVGAPPCKPRPPDRPDWGVRLSSAVITTLHWKKKKKKKRISGTNSFTAPPKHSKHSPPSSCNLFVSSVLLGPLGRIFVPGALPLPPHHLLRPFLGLAPSRPNTSFYTALKEDGGISSRLRNVLKTPFFARRPPLGAKKGSTLWFAFHFRLLFWMLFLYFDPLFQFLGVYFSVFFYFLIYWYIYIYKKISFGHRKAIFLVEASCRKLKLKASFDNYL